ncbi:MAG: TMEM175 family protein [Vicinamibacteria bacterium]
MSKGRLEAFSDGVVAILITIMVLELKVPHGTELSALRPLLPALLSYLLSFVFLAIYWNNHHHLLQAARHVDGRILWANVHLLFWLSLVPFVTAWMGENFAPVPVAAYGVVLMLAGVAYYILARALVRRHGRDSRLALAIGSDFKGRLSVGLYAVAVLLAFWEPAAACLIYVLVAITWLVPDPRIERALAAEEAAE